jgi:predicted phosphodiesterase
VGRYALCSKLVPWRSQRLFAAHVSEVISDPSAVDPKHVPSYYQEEIPRIQLWFRIDDSINQIPYDHTLASKTGEPTFMLLGETVLAAESRSPGIAAQAAVPSVIIHVSDLHFGDEHAFRFGNASTPIGGPAIELAHAIVDDVNRLPISGRIGVLIVSGDLTTKARWDPEFMDRVVGAMDVLREGLNVPKDRVLIVPGNHDFPRATPDAQLEPAKVAQRSAVRYEHEDKFRIFLNQWLDRNVSLPLSRCVRFACEGFELCVGALNSSGLTATEFTEYGYVGDALEEVLTEMKNASPAIKVLVLHHHLVPIAYVEIPNKRGVSLTLDASKVLELAQKHGVQLVLHGHQHIPKVVKTAQVYFSEGTWRGLSDEDVFILASGSAGSTRHEQGLSNTYSVLEFGQDGTRVTYRKIDPMGQELGNFITVSLPIVPH